MAEYLDIDAPRTEELIERYYSGWRRLFSERKIALSDEEMELYNKDPGAFVCGPFCKNISCDLFSAFHRSSLQDSIPHGMTDRGDSFDIFHYAFTNHTDLASFIDLGCGIGMSVAIGSKLGFNSIGIENNLELITLGRDIFKKHNIAGERLIQGNFLDNSFWENNHYGVTPKAPNLFLVYLPESLMENALRVISNNLHQDSRIVTGADYFNEYTHTVIDKTLYKFNLEVESPTYSRYFVLKKK